MDLVKRNVINLTFVDAPFHKHSSLYARYFLYIQNEKKRITYTLAARTALFEAAGSGIVEKDKLEEFLRSRKIAFKPFDEKSFFTTLEGYMLEDKITATPIMVIYRSVEKEVYKGTNEILKGLESLK